MSERANNGGWPSTRTARHRGLAANRAEITKAGQAALQFAVVALAYFIVAKLGLYLAVVHPSVSNIACYRHCHRSCAGMGLSGRTSGVHCGFLR
jgi:hypothetical protein